MRNGSDVNISGRLGETFCSLHRYRSGRSSKKLGLFPTFFVCLFVSLYFLWAMKFNVAFDTWLPDRFLKNMEKRPHFSEATETFCVDGKLDPILSVRPTDKRLVGQSACSGPASSHSVQFPLQQQLLTRLRRSAWCSSPAKNKINQTSRCDRFSLFVLIHCLKMRPCVFGGP